MKNQIILSIASLMALGAAAAPITPSQALDRMSQSAEGRRLLKAAGTPALAFTAKDSRGQAAVYVFNQPSGKGFMLLSGDDVAVPMLGYTDSGEFDPADIPAPVEYWLAEYARQIEYARSHGADPMKSARMEYPTSWTYIAPMVATKWDQGVPFNDQTPTVGSSHTPTGCVATAMAQIMKYWNYPDVGEGSIAYQWNGTRLSMTLSRYPFAWSDMLDTYVKGQYSDAQAEAVSTLMKACGYGAQMYYAMGGSGTQTANAGIAMAKYFKYDSDIAYAQRMFHADSEWTALVYDQLKNVGPVLYDGSSPGGGHAFVVDGYDGNGYFHVNWGWGGTCNGYYLLTALNPTQQGTGGSYGGYNYGQGLLYNIKKAEGPQHALEGKIDMCGTLSATISGKSLTFTLSDWNDPAPGFLNLSLASFQPTFGIAVQKADGTGNVTYVQGTQRSGALEIGTYIGANFHPTAGLPDGLADGRYKVTLIYRNGAVSNSPWQFFDPIPGMYDYVYVTKSGNSYSVENLTPKKLQISNAKIVTPLYYGNPCKIEFTVTNPSDMEITQSVIPTLSVDGTVYYESDSQLIAVGPNETVTKTLVYTFSSVKSGQTPTTVAPKDFTLGAFDFNTNTVYGSYGTVTMYRSASNLKINLDDFSVVNSQSYDNDVYGIADFSNMQIKATVTVNASNAFIASPLTAVVYESNETGGNAAEVYEKEFENYIYLGTGDSATETTTLNFTDYSPWKMYNLCLYYLNGTKRTLLGTIRFASSGVGEVNADGELSLSYSGSLLTATSEEGTAAIEVYDAKGALITAGKDSLDLSTLAPGLYIVRAADKAGNGRSMKIVK